MNQLRHFIKRDSYNCNRSGRFKTKKEAYALGKDLAPTTIQHNDGSWDLE